MSPHFWKVGYNSNFRKIKHKSYCHCKGFRTREAKETRKFLKWRLLFHGEFVRQAKFKFQRRMSKINRLVVKRQSGWSDSRLPDTAGIIQRVVKVTKHSLLMISQSNKATVQNRVQESEIQCSNRGRTQRVRHVAEIIKTKQVESGNQTGKCLKEQSITHYNLTNTDRRAGV